MTDTTDFTEDEWYLIEQAVKPLRFTSEEYADLYEKLTQRTGAE